MKNHAQVSNNYYDDFCFNGGKMYKTDEIITKSAFISESSNEGAVCCRAMIAKCLACSAGVSLSAYCARRMETTGCGGRFQ